MGSKGEQGGAFGEKGEQGEAIRSNGGDVEGNNGLECYCKNF